MRNGRLSAGLLLLGASLAFAQDAVPAAAIGQVDGQKIPVKVYAVGAIATAPELLTSIATEAVTEKCKKRFGGQVEFSLLVDTAGKPRNLTYLRASGAPVDQVALQLVSAEQFRPGELGGVPVVVARTVGVDIQVCVAEVKDGAGKKTGQLRLVTQADQKWGTPSQVPDEAVLTSELPVSGDKPLTLQQGVEVGFPKPINRVEAQFSEEARKAKYQGVCVVGLTVDEQGIPQDVHVIQAIGMGLDEKAIEAVKKYRFSPGMEYGVAVPVSMAISVNFRLYDDPHPTNH